MPRLTSIGGIFLGVNLVLYVAARTSQSGLLLLLIGVILGCFIVQPLVGRRTLRRIHLAIPARQHLPEGQPATLPWTIANRSTAPSGWGWVRGLDGPRLRFPGLPPGGEAHLLPALPHLKRGVYSHKDLFLSTTYPFGLWEIRRPFPLDGELVVYPAVYEVPPPLAAGYDLMAGGKHHGIHRIQAGAVFAGVRPLQPGDSFKQIHWKSSAKGLGWMVKTFEEELAGRVAVLIDGGPTQAEAVFENCVRAAASLILAALDEGHHVEWICLGDLHHRLVTPFSDGSDTLEAMARIRGVPQSLTAERLRQAGEAASRRSALAVVLTDCPVSVQEILRQWVRSGRTVSLYLPPNVKPDLDGVVSHHYMEDSLWLESS